MHAIEIRDGSAAQTLPLPARLILGAAHGLPDGALELEPRAEGVVVLPRIDALVGSQKLMPHARRLVRPGEAVTVAGKQVAVVRPPDTAPETRLLARALLRGAPRAGARPGVPSLLWLNGPELGKRVNLLEEATFLGRGDGCVARVNDAQASRMHAKIVRGPEGYRLLDLMSANGVLVDGVRLEEARALGGDEIIQIGNTVIAFEKPLEAKKPPPQVAPEAPKPAAVEAKKPEPAKVDVAPTPAPAPTPRKPAAKKVVGAELALIGVAIAAMAIVSAVVVWAVG